MSEHQITVPGGESVRLLTAGKYCDRDIVVTAEGGTAEPVIEPLEVTENRTYTAPDGVDGYSPVTVNVPVPDGYLVPSGSLAISKNGTYDVAEKASVVVDVASSGGEFPDGYTRCDYIQFSGDESIDTGIICNQDTQITVRYTRDDSAAQYLYGVVNSDNTASVTAYLSSGGSWRFGNKSASRSIATADKMIRTAIVSKTGIESDSGASTYSGVTDFETPDTLILGGCHYSSGSIGTGFTGKVLGFEIRQGGETVLKLVPVVSADGVYRFWDKVGQRYADTVQGLPLGGGNW